MLTDETRLSILLQLEETPRTVGELNDSIDIAQNLLSHHLRVLREAGMVEAERDGRAVRYRLAAGVRTRGPGTGINIGCCRVTFSKRN